MNKNKKFVFAFVLISICFVVVTILFVLAWLQRGQYKSALENRYHKSYVQLIDNIDDIEVDLSKLVATTSIASQQKIMQNIYTCCVLASENLGNLPIYGNSLGNVNQLVNKIGGYVYSLMQSSTIVTGDVLTSVEGLHQSISVVKYDLNKGFEQTVLDGAYLTESAYDKEGSSFTAGLVSGESSYGDIPSLIYDGPFSESVLNKEPKVSEDVVSEYEAGKKVESLLEYWQGYTIKYDGVTKGKLSTYNYILSGESEIFVQVLQNGGKLLSAVSYGDYVGGRIDVSEAISMSKEIAYKFGFEDMVEVWHQVVQDVVYINLAPMIDGVIYYSDLLKLKIDLNGGDLLGFEGTNYIYNHFERGQYNSGISIIEAQALLSESLLVEERNYCVIPNEFVGESDAYEFRCTWSGYTYYVYLDSVTGEELKIMRIIETNNGLLLE